MPFDAAPPVTNPIRALARKLGYVASSGEKLVAVLEFHAEQCSHCRGWFMPVDMYVEDDPWREDPHECHWCRWGLERRAA